MNKIKFGIIFLFLIFLSNCQTARVRFTPVTKPIESMVIVTPEECKGKKIDKKKCDAARAKQKEELIAKEKEKEKNSQNNPKEPLEIQQKFYVWGFYPSKIIVDLSKEGFCANGYEEIKQQNTYFDELLAMFTAGMYMPRTLVIYCQ